MFSWHPFYKDSGTHSEIYRFGSIEVFFDFDITADNQLQRVKIKAAFDRENKLHDNDIDVIRQELETYINSRL
jgi:hypothetical protein